MSVEDAKGFWTRLPLAMCKRQKIPIPGGDSLRRLSSASSGSSTGRRRQTKRQSMAHEEPSGDRGEGNYYRGADNREAEEQCWNGSEAGKYSNSVVRDGLASQEMNPEVPVDISKPDIGINEQIFALKLITKKLESAYNGQPVEWANSRNRKYKLRQRPCTGRGRPLMARTWFGEV